MNQAPLVFAIPTYRLRDVSDAVRAYDENFRHNGHSVPLMVFDDSTLANHDKYFPLLEQTETANELIYVGPHQKEQFIRFLQHHLRDRKLDSLVRNLFRPSYGGNRNFTLIYTLGQLMVSADDDMRPEAIIEDSPESLSGNEVSRGKLIRPEDKGHALKSYDLLTVFKEVLGKRAADVPSNFAFGEHLVDSAMDLETNSSKGYFRENSLTLQPGVVPPTAIIKVAQTYRTGTDDIDALDFAHIFLANDDQRTPDELTDLYMLVNFRPAVTNKNWRIDCGVAGYDNRLGLPPFFPTRLRFEDYIYRLWIQQKGIVSAHVDAAQRHTKNNYMRNPLAAEIFNEEISNLLKRKLKASVQRMDELTVSFGYDGAVSHADTEETMEKIRAVHEQAVSVAARTKDPERRQSLEIFAANLAKSFYGFESDFFQQNVSRIVDDVLSQIYSSIELWPRLVEICYYHKDRREFPQVRVRNRRPRRIRQASISRTLGAAHSPATQFSVVARPAA
jgi:hypothetical protein